MRSTPFPFHFSPPRLSSETFHSARAWLLWGLLLVLLWPGMLAGSTLPPVLGDDLDSASLKQVLRNQLQVMEAADPSRRVRLGERKITQGELVATLKSFLRLVEKNLPPSAFQRRVAEEYEFYKVGKGSKKRVLYTGYYTPVIRANIRRSEQYRYPLYRLPDDSGDLRFIGHPQREEDGGPGAPPVVSWQQYTREDIDRHGVLKNRKLEIAWLADDLERFFLHIQGSGMLLFPDGTTQGVRFAGANDHTYTGIGKLMMKDGLLGRYERSMQGIKGFLRKNPAHIPKYLYQNKRYIFFAYTDAGPRGSGGGELVAGRSLATDKSIYPPGGLAFVRMRKPILNDRNKIVRWQWTSRYLVDQDTGSDITGPGRGDIYFGTGQRAGVIAGNFKERGELYYVLKKR